LADDQTRVAAYHSREKGRQEQDRLRQIRQAQPEERAKTERLRLERQAEKERIAREAEEAARRAMTRRNYKAEEHLRRIEAGLPHDGHPNDPDWDRL
jgi:hypothetical protein